MKKNTVILKAAVILHEIFLVIIQAFLRVVIGLFCLIKYRLNYHIPREVKKMKPPYIVMGDHVHLMDPFIHGLGLINVIHWVAADANFRNPLMKLVMISIAGAVAKSKNRSDMVTLSKLKLLVESGCAIGVYQEGERSWDGMGRPYVSGTDKLIRFLKVPVIYIHLEGAYLDHPRWSWSSNGAEIHVRYEIMIGREEAKEISLSEISRRIVETSKYNEWDYKSKGYQPLRGEKRAENLELVCFTCPQCHSINTLKSRGNDFSCSSCGLQGALDRFGEFIWNRVDFSRAGGVPFPTVREWNQWQIDYFKSRIASLNSESLGKELFWEDRESVSLTRGKRKGRLKKMGTGTTRLFGNRIEFDCIGRETMIFPLENLSSFSVFKQYYTEFYYQKMLHRFTFTNRSVSGYKWLLLNRLLQEDRSVKNDK
jgi:1-acyl-sn-glycerol-3-phosphate acyltransferase